MNQSKMWINPRKKKSKQFKINKMNFNVKQTFLKKLSRKIWRFSMLVVENNYPVYNYMFKIDIKSTRTRCEICSKLTIKTAGPFFYCWLWICTFLLDSYLNFIAWMIFIILVVFIVFMICRKIGIRCTFWN